MLQSLSPLEISVNVQDPNHLKQQRASGLQTDFSFLALDYGA
jgi:hypothetical protein